MNNNTKNISLDTGYFFGMGIFETIAVEKGHPLFLDWHLERMQKGLKTLGISTDAFQKQATPEQIARYLTEHPMDHGVLKIMASEENLLFTTRENPYTDTDYERGFRLDLSPVLRNETSSFTYIKSFHYGDNLLEKRRAKQAGYDETLFRNTKGYLVETSASNIFFVKKQQLFTPAIHCGLLDGIVRRYILENYNVKETLLLPEELSSFDEAFLTNSLMGIMPVVSIDDHVFTKRSYTDHLLNCYRKDTLL